MKHFEIEDLNTSSYWDSHQTAVDYGLRQQKYASLVGSGDKILDIGCGLSPFLAHVPFKEKWGTDFSPKTIRVARKDRKINYCVSEATDTPFKDNYFDAVVAGEVIEHLKEPEKLLVEMYRVCKAGGIMVLSTPHLEFLDKEHLWEFEASDFPGWEHETVKSERFKGREYLFLWRRKENHV